MNALGRVSCGSIPPRLPRWADVRRLILNSGGGEELASPWTQQPWIERLHLPAIPLEPWTVGRAINGRLQRSAIRQLDRWVDEHTWLVLAKPCALALTLCRRYANRPTMFDVMDAVSEFSSGASKRWLSHCEAFLATCCTRVIVTAPSLLSHLGIDPNDARVSVIPNGLGLPPPNHSARRAPTIDRPLRFVYVGVIAESPSPGVFHFHPSVCTAPVIASLPLTHLPTWFFVAHCRTRNSPPCWGKPTSA